MVKVKIDVEQLEEIIEYLKSKPQVIYNPYPQYDRKIFELLGSLDYDTAYLEKHEKTSQKDIADMRKTDLRVMFTFISRSERFCDGSIASYLEDGTLLKLAERELELVSK